ncbi:MAG: hypothetical protein AAF702_39275 [Chloroflexota bacterium]
MIEQLVSRPQTILLEKIQWLGNTTHQFALTTVGLVAMGTEESQRLWRQRVDIMEKAQARGVAVEDNAIQTIKDLEQTLVGAASQLGASSDALPNPITIVNTVAKGMREQVNSYLANFAEQPVEQTWQDIEIVVADGVSEENETVENEPGDNGPFKDAMSKSETFKSATLADKADIEHKVPTPAVSTEASSPIDDSSSPFTNYDNMTAKEIISQLQNLESKQIKLVAQYERNHANRRTILQAIERLSANDD